ncbi:rRNA processing domain-containing protein [Ditylenchus destructor]|nr:rRNA processing domain-containing protein [Ditylenchus destructor]
MADRGHKFKKNKVSKPEKPISTEMPESSQTIEKKKVPYVSAYKRAQQTYERIQAERKAQAEERRQENERRETAVQHYNSLRKKMNGVLKRTTKKGQPKLDAQIAVLVEKIERRDNPLMKRKPKKLENSQ